MVVGPSLDAEADVRQFKTRHKLTYPLLTEAQTSADAYAVTAYPTVVVAGKDRKVLWYGNHPDEKCIAAIEAALKVPDPPAPKIQMTVFKLKDGTTVRAKSAIDAGDSYSIKDEADKLLSLKKDQITDMKKEEAAPAEAAKAEAPADTAKPAKKMTTYVLKDGRKIRAQTAIAGETEYTIKDESGKFISIPKDDVAQILKD